MNKKPTKIDGLNDLRRQLILYHYMGLERLPFALKTLESIIVFNENEEVNNMAEIEVVTLEKVRKELGECQRCKLHKSRKTIVFGEGDNSSGLMFIGEGPGEEEDLQGRPFVGKAGALLNSLINKMGLKRQEVYITNAVKCRPPGNRDPEPDELETCRPFLIGQIQAIKPYVIIGLGRVASQSLLNTTTSITALRGNVHDLMGIPFIPTFHPAYLLRNPKAKWATWEDAQRALKILSENNPKKD